MSVWMLYQLVNDFFYVLILGTNIPSVDIVKMSKATVLCTKISLCAAFSKHINTVCGKTRDFQTDKT